MLLKATRFFSSKLLPTSNQVMEALAKSYWKKTNRMLTAVIVLPVIIFCSAHFAAAPSNAINDQLDAWYLQQLKKLKQEVYHLQQTYSGKKSLAACQQQFNQARLTYKKAAIFIEYFNPYEARYLNGPNLPRTEDDNPDKIIKPHGFQVLEDHLFGEEQSISAVKEETAHLLQYLERLENEPDRINKFRDEEVWEAVRSAVIRMITLGISGFDSPVAQYSLQEARSTLQGINGILAIYKTKLDKKDPELYRELMAAITSAESFLSSSPSFNGFDRLTFITRFANPLSSVIYRSRLQLGYLMPEGLRPLNDANTIFDPNAFNINFFSPNDRFRTTPERVALGKLLFYDPVLSGTRKRSCATCHQPEKAFTDGHITALSIDEKSSLSRNTPTLWNSAFQTRQFFDSRTSVLEYQLSEVVHNETEMKGSLKESVETLKNDTKYSALFQKAYGDEKEFVSQYTIANAISSYVRSLVALNARFDQYMRGNSKALGMAEKNGFNLFMGKAKCGTCHFMPLFNGLVPPDFVETESEVLGVPKTKDSLHAELDSDLGKFNFTHSIVHKHAFKTPTLRNVELTAPYMHNGVFSTLEEVMDFYNKGGGYGLKIAPENQTLPFDKLQLSKKEISEIIAFMKTLTDTSSHK